MNGTETIIPVENEFIRVGFTNKGGQPKWVELKEFKAPDSSTVKLAATDFDKFTYSINTGNNKTADISSFYFSGGQVTKDANGNQVITFQLQSPQGALVHQYVIKPKNYFVDFNLGVEGANNLLSQNQINFTWQNRAVQLQKDLKYERQQSNVAYRENGDYDHSTALSSDAETFNKGVNWVAVKQQFFNSTFVAKNNFTSGSIQWVTPKTGNVVVEATANLKMQLPAGSKASVPLGMYYGPTDYKILKQYGNDMEDMVNLGSGMFAFVKYINRWIVIPVFDLFKQLTSNFGIVILLLTLFIRLLISPLTYTSYLSGAKMKVLRPEIEQLKAKHGGDQQAMSMDQMKLFREAGVNPLGGCIPSLLQIPIFFALYSFFNSNVALRGKNFLWAHDLSQYDSIAQLPFNVPFYGDHVSLFTITAILTSLAISLYSMNSMPDQGNPVMKYMPYIFPVILLFVFNSLPAGLTWYYTVSNVITLLLQFVIQNYIINHDKILAKMEENRKKPKTKSKWQERMEQMQDQQRKVQEMQQKIRSNYTHFESPAKSGAFSYATNCDI
ncbi:membrane protein insertase YidC [Flavisolibacter tropicus]|uniref:membrane protein insertase YidC n=1 Tax=Flavisolibacter tropicus TaxID=1492898 RepID=UPI001D0370A9|nr:membrane protein insertase YidC [Flavisolibacter tropicus]